MAEVEHISSILPRALLELAQQWKEQEKQSKEQENEENPKESIIEAGRV